MTLDQELLTYVCRQAVFLVILEIVLLLSFIALIKYTFRRGWYRWLKHRNLPALNLLFYWQKMHCDEIEKTSCLLGWGDLMLHNNELIPVLQINTCQDQVFFSNVQSSYQVIWISVLLQVFIRQMESDKTLDLEQTVSSLIISLDL